VANIRVLIKDHSLIVLQLTRKEAGNLVANLSQQLANEHVGSQELGFVHLMDEDGTERRAYFNAILDQDEAVRNAR